MEVGQSFSLGISDDMKTHSWGLNDFMQLGRQSSNLTLHSEPQVAKPLNNLQPKMVASGNDHTLLLDYNGNVYAWGANNCGQLGLGNTREANSIVSLTRLGRDVRYVAAKGKHSYIINNEGKCMKW